MASQASFNALKRILFGDLILMNELLSASPGTDLNKIGFDVKAMRTEANNRAGNVLEELKVATKGLNPLLGKVVERLLNQFMDDGKSQIKPKASAKNSSGLDTQMETCSPIAKSKVGMKRTDDTADAVKDVLAKPKAKIAKKANKGKKQPDVGIPLHTTAVPSYTGPTLGSVTLASDQAKSDSESKSQKPKKASGGWYEQAEAAQKLAQSLNSGKVTVNHPNLLPLTLMLDKKTRNTIESVILTMPKVDANLCRDEDLFYGNVHTGFGFHHPQACSVCALACKYFLPTLPSAVVKPSGPLTKALISLHIAVKKTKTHRLPWRDLGKLFEDVSNIACFAPNAQFHLADLEKVIKNVLPQFDMIDWIR